MGPAGAQKPSAVMKWQPPWQMQIGSPHLVWSVCGNPNCLLWQWCFLRLLTSCFCLHTRVLWKAVLEEVQGMFPRLLFIWESSTEARCKTFQPGVESCLGTFNHSLNSTGIWRHISNVGVILILPLVATVLSPQRMEKNAVGTDICWRGGGRGFPFLSTWSCCALHKNALSFMDTGQRGEKSLFNLGISYI